LKRSRPAAGLQTHSPASAVRLIESARRHATTPHPRGVSRPAPANSREHPGRDSSDRT
jgi:hypothetical protein